MTKQVIRTDSLAAPIAHFSRGERVGNAVYIGATSGREPGGRPAGGTPGMVDMEAQTDRMLANIQTALSLLGTGMQDVVKVKGYLTDWRDLATYDQVYVRHFHAPHPVRATAGTSAFPPPSTLVEVEVEARVGVRRQRVESDPPPPSAGPGPRGGLLAGDTFHTVQTPAGPDGRLAGDARAQSERALANLSLVLEAAGLAPRDVVMVTATVADARYLEVFEEAYRRYFAPPYPARSVAFSKLSLPEQVLELEVVAVVGGERVYLASTRDPWAAEAPVRASDRLPRAWACFSHGVLAGDFLYVSGQLGLDAEGQPAEGITAQTDQALRNVQAVAELVGLSLQDVVRSTALLPDLRQYRGFNAGYGPLFSPPYPSRTTVEQGLSVPGLWVQIEALLSPLARESVVLTA